MSPARKGLVLAGLALFLLATGWEIARQSEHWPLSPYAMFGRVETERAVRRLVVVGHTAAGRRVALLDGDLVAPFEPERLRAALRSMEGDPPRLRRALGDVLARYEARRRRGGHRGPPLAAVALEEVVWRVDRAVPEEAPGTRREIARVAAGGEP